MTIYGLYLSLIELIVFGFILLSFTYQIYFYFRYLNAVLQLRTKIKKDTISFETEKQPVSVIICARDEADNLRKFLPFVLEQDYPEFEVIVINDGSTDDTHNLLKDLCEVHPNLKTTFVPAGANNLSTKKLGITLGIKASKYDILLLTDADCMPEDKTWIDRMTRNFSSETEFVLGYGAYFEKKGFLNRLITFDTLFIALQYMGMAIARKPYMGVGRNLAYRKETFFAQKGFAPTLHLISGDDDLLVNKASTKSNTKVEVSAESITWSEPNTTLKSWLYQKQRHLSVSSFYTSKTKSRLFFEPFTRGLFYLSFILSIIFGGFITQIAAGSLLLIRLIVQLVIINSASKHFGGRKYLLTLPVLDIILPLISLYMLTFRKEQKSIRWK